VIMDILAQAAAYFEARPTQSIEVPEWSDDPAKPVIAYFKTPNAATLSKVTREAKGDSIEMVARLVAIVVEDGNGKKLFRPLDYKELLIRTDPAALNRVAAAIMDKAEIDEVEAEKN
jgi:hypothetical protein